MNSEERAPGHECEECGAVVDEGRKGCQAMFDEVLAREFGDFRYARLHRLTVDTYSMQHPGEYMRSVKSYIAHLTGMYAALELEDTAAVNQAMQRWLNGPKDVERPDEPPQRRRGELTISHVIAASEPEEHLSRVREWAESTWKAWSGYHETARRWIEIATKTP